MKRDINHPLYALLGFLAILVLLLSSPLWADDDPPQTEVRICGGTLPATSLLSNHDAPCYNYTITATDIAHPGYLSHRSDDQFRHVYWKGGDPACIYTGDYHRATGHSVFYVTDQAGGRNCRDSTNDGQCAYIATGYAIFAVTGQGCSQAGVPICTGPLCI